MLNFQVLIEKLPLIKQSICALKIDLKKLKTFAASDFRGKKYFEEDGAQHYLVFQPMYRYF